MNYSHSFDMFSLDQVDRPGQEEFIWAMRSRNRFSGEEEQWRERRLGSESFSSRRSRKSSGVTPETAGQYMESCTKLIASFLPDEILSDPTNYNDRIYDVAVARARITGFQELWDKYRAIGKGGALRMGQMLNNYLGNAMQEALVYNGDMIRCSGTNFTIMWKQGNRTMADCVHQAVDCGLGISKNFANFENDVGITISVSISISCGSVIFAVVGTQKRSTFVVTGDALEDTKEILKKMRGNQVMIDQAAWEHLNSIEYIAKAFDEDYDLYVIQDFSTAWRSIHDVDDKPTELDQNLVSDSNASLSQFTARRKVHELYRLRPSIGDAVTMKIYPDLKRFIIPPLIATIESVEPMESLIEMRYMVIMVTSFAFEAQSYHQMIKLTDLFYRMLNNIIEPYHGYVNRLTYVENELVFYTLFGIHGDNHNYESRNALKAAMKCFKGSENAIYINSLSMAVVSGWIFCGPVGHHMRRDYVSIGANINRGRRYIEAYPNKVTCDMETFLKSKLDARHFILQEKRPPETFPDLGCVYEYIEPDTTNRIPKFYVSKFPILDREYEIETFKNMVVTVSKRRKKFDHQRFRMRYEASGLFFIGRERSGKSRLIEELAFQTSTDLPMFRLRLNHLDKHVPYQTIYYFFGVPLGIADNSTMSDREAKLLSKLRNLPLDGLQCMLNMIFRVNFPKVPVFASLKQQEMCVIMQNLIKCLCNICFTKPWVVFIDNAENIDSESWDLIYTILETHLVLVVAAIGCSKVQDLPPNAQNVIAYTKCKCVNLLPIDKLYHTTLACQMLEVQAIPIQLEKLLQDKSEGSPGWFENFLLSLIHHNIIWIRKVDNMDKQPVDLVLPFKDNMKRDMSKLNQIVLFKTSQGVLQPALILYRKKWEIFQTVANVDMNVPNNTLNEDAWDHDLSATPRSSKTGTLAGSLTATSPTGTLVNLMGRNKQRSTSKESLRSVHRRPTKQMSRNMADDMDDESHGKTHNLCLLGPGGEEQLYKFDVSTVSHFECIKIMDRLTSFEMAFLKAASVIGDFFLRDTLMFVVSVSHEIDIAAACQHLFELRIIACAEGDFRRSLMNYAPVMSERFKSFDDTIVQCNCVGFLISEGCRSFKRYANCGFMRFVSEDFRRAVYSLLTTAQLHELHTKALNFLEKGTRKCVSCGNGVFTKILGNKYEEGVLAERGKRRASSRPEREVKTSASILEYWDYVGHSTTTVRSSGMRRIERTRSSKMEVGIIFASFSKSKVSGDKAKVPPTFEESDFTMCECDRILRCLYHHIRHHCEVTENYEKWLHATLEYAVLCTEDSNVAMALKCLNHALDIIKGPYKEIANPGESWKYNVMKARVMSEIGRARSMIGQTRLAYQAYEKALHFYGYKLPKASSLRYKLMDFWEYIRLTMRSRRGIGTKFGYVAEFCDSLSSCLGMMTKLFISLDMWDNAYIAALWSMKKSLQSEKNFIALINSFTNLIYVSARTRKFSIIDPLETMALDYCRRYKCSIDVNDLKSISYLYSSIFYARIQRGRFEDAFSIGVVLDSVTDMLHLRELLITLFPLFFEMLLVRSDINDVLNALTTFEQVTVIAGEYIGDVWFYAQAIYFQLQTGCMLVKIAHCEDYYYTQNKHLINLKEPDAERRFFVGIWLWYLRTENYVIADMWEKKLPEVWVIDPHESVNNLITSLMYIEGLIILVTYKMDKKMLFIIESMNYKIDSLFRYLEQQAEKVKIIAPRLYHLKAFFHMCKMEEYKGWEMLDKAIKLAQSTNNLYDLAWAKHSERAWKQDMPDTERTCWRDHANIELMDYREIESNDYKIFFFTLEMPMYL